MFSSPAEAMEIETSTETHPSTPNTSTTHIINIPSVLQDTPQPTQDAPMNSGTQEMPDASSAAATQEPSTQAEEATSEPSPPSTALHFTSDFTPTGRITMVSKSYHDSSQSTLREFTLQHGEAQKTIWHISFLAWPDHSVPKTLESRNELMNLIRFARQKNNDVFTTPSPTAEDSVLSTETESPSASSPVIATANQNPIVVHCSAGCGRTGTYMALEHLLSELHEGSLPERDSPQPSPSPDTVPNTNPHIPSTTVQTANQDGIKSPAKSHPDPINATVQTLRDQRMIMVQTSDQFQLLYTMIKTEFIKRRQALHEAAKEEQKRCELEAEENRRKAALSDAVASSASTHASTEKKINGKGEPLAKAQKRGLGFRNALLRTISGRKAPVVDESSKATPAQNGGGSQELPTSTSSQRSVPEGEGSGSDSAIPSSITDAGTAAPDTTKVASV
ncbi:hypothetical protein MMC25_002248 [Agyrium rufum]|nr:hypothetical protein [Agyrium rufum]